MSVHSIFAGSLEAILGWPFITYVITIGIICTAALGFVQFKYFFRAWKATFFPEKPQIASTTADMSPFQAFLNALNSSIGNGTIAGVATAIAIGGPGAAFWIATISFILMILRFAEVYLSAYYSAKAPAGTAIGGPMLYLNEVHSVLPYIYAAFCLFFGLMVGNTMQSNSINLGFEMATGWNIAWVIAILVSLFVGYILLGGASRVAKASEAIVPFKVGLFFTCAIIIFIYHYQHIIPSIALIFKSSFEPSAAAGGIAGFSIQTAMREGISRSISTTESGLGTAGILFGSTGSKTPFKDGLMGMLSSFISSLSCFITALLIMVSGVWNSGLTSTALASKAFGTVFGLTGNWVVMILSISFGIGVLVTYSYITREAWLFLTKQRYNWAFNLLFCMMAFAGPLIDVKRVWSLVEIASDLMIFLNLFGIVMLIPVIRRGIKTYRASN